MGRKRALLIRLPVLFCTELRASESDLTSVLPRLSPARRAMVLRRHKKEQGTAAYAELLLQYGIRMCGYTPYASAEIDWSGKPHFISDSVPLTFNLSHAGNTAALLLAPKSLPCGVDCEEYRVLQNMDAIAEKMFTDAENRWLSAQPDRIRAFFRLWTAKEAFIKYTGEGFSRPLHTVETDFGTRIAKTETDNLSCFIYHYETEHAVLCAALDIDTPPEFRLIPAEVI